MSRDYVIPPQMTFSYEDRQHSVVSFKCDDDKCGNVVYLTVED